MTFNDRIHAVKKFGFSGRQARFLVTVMLHGGVCVPRQYATLAGTAYGRRVNAFFDKLVTLRYAARCRCVHNRAAVYHVRYRPLYRAIGEPHSRNRKPVPAARIVERLMLLDAVIAHPEVEWLATATDKIEFFTAASTYAPSRWPRETVGDTERFFPNHLLIGVSSTRRLIFLFLATTSLKNDLKASIRRHAEILESLPAWTVRLVLPPPVAGVKSWLEAVVRDELAKAQLLTVGGVESEVLPHSYRHLSPLTEFARPVTKGVEEGEREGERILTRPQPRRVECEDDEATGGAHDWRVTADVH